MPVVVQSFGRIVVTATPDQVAFAAKVYSSRLPGKPFAGDLEPRDFPIKLLTAQQMYDAGAVIPGTEDPNRKRWPKGLPAYGFTFPTYLAINSDEPLPHQRYAFEHEPFHPIIAAHMTATKAKLLRPLVEKVIGGTAYQNRLSEVLCDAFVELFYGHSIEDKYYGDIANADLQKAWDILMQPTTEKPAPVDPPAPLPLDPKDAQIADLTAQLRAKDDALLAANSAAVTAQGQVKGAFLAMHRLEDQLTAVQTAAQAIVTAATPPTDLPADPEIENPVQD